MASSRAAVEVARLASCNPNPTNGRPPPHHVGNPPTSFINPWPSNKTNGFAQVLATRFGNNRNFVPVPSDRQGLVNIRTPDFGLKDDPKGNKLKATWIGHASWLIETGADGNSRGVRVALDPVFSERTSPFSFLGPKRYSPTPCTLEELPYIDAVVISHNHYDHLDLDTIKTLYQKQGQLQIFCPLGNKAWFLSLGIGIRDSEVIELDWWDGVELHVAEIGTVQIICTPAQHFSSRTPFDRDKTLWASWVFVEGPTRSSESVGEGDSQPLSHTKADSKARRLYFAGDTGYRAVPTPDPTPEEEASFPHCPAFADIGNTLGPFDLALLPIGLFMPRDHMSPVHCSPGDAICVHRDIKSKRSIGMHYGTVRGGLSAHYEDVTYPPRRFQELCEESGLEWGKELGLCDIGETVFVV